MGSLNFFSYATYQYYNFGGTFGWWRTGAPLDTDGNLYEFPVSDLVFNVDEDIYISPGGASFDYKGTYSFDSGGVTYSFYAFRTLNTTGTSGNILLFSDQDVAGTLYAFGIDPLDIVAGPLNVACFASGTRIAVPDGSRRVENLRAGDRVTVVGGEAAEVLWVGRQRLDVARLQLERPLVRIAAGALGNGAPERDLVVTCDHGMVLDGLVVTAGALVDAPGVDRLPAVDLQEPVTVYHIETAAHETILANGAAAETFIDAAGRAAFDNHGEYLALCGTERIVPEMRLPRVTSARLLPARLRERLKIRDADVARMIA